MNKSRTSYLELLELRAKERPNDYYGLFFLSHEYFYRHMYEKSIEVLKNIVSKFSNNFTLTELAGAYLFLGDDYRKLNDKEMAIYYYNLGIKVEPTFRECYLNAAEIFNELQMYDIAVAYTNTALKKCYRHYVWLERDNSYNGQPEDILSISYYYIALEDNCKNKLKYLSKSYKYVNFALSCDVNNERLKHNKNLIYDELLKELNKVES
jgi:tetratricopeptide (TPR) repeat protein